MSTYSNNDLINIESFKDNGIDKELIERIKLKSYEVLKANRCIAKIPYYIDNTTEYKTFIYTSPSQISGSDSHMDYTNKQWLWDSCLHSYILAEVEPEIAKQELRALCFNQKENGFIPHMNYWDGDGLIPPEWAKMKGLKLFWSNPFSSDITQPPIIAFALEEIYHQTKDRTFLIEMLPKLVKYYHYLAKYRDPDNDGLISILHPWESGWDNSQRWDTTLNIPGNKDYISRSVIDERKIQQFISNVKENWNEEAIFIKGEFDIEPVDFNVLYCINLQALLRLLIIAGDKEDYIKTKTIEAKTRKAILETMWDGNKYVDLSGKNNIPSDIKSSAMFYPLLLEGEMHYEELINNYLLNSNEFLTPYGITTTSKSNPTFSPDDYWRGNVWFSNNYFILQGLKKIYNCFQYEPAKKGINYIINSSFYLLDKFEFYEYFNPLNGKGHGVKPLSWNAIVTKMVTFNEQY
ncbi:MAG: trehalase family glycosidase [Cyanobacteriota bacterium]